MWAFDCNKSRWRWMTLNVTVNLLLCRIWYAYIDQTTETRIMQFSLKCSPRPYLFACQVWLRNSHSQLLTFYHLKALYACVHTCVTSGHIRCPSHQMPGYRGASAASHRRALAQMWLVCVMLICVYKSGQSLRSHSSLLVNHLNCCFVGLLIQVLFSLLGQINRSM